MTGTASAPELLNFRLPKTVAQQLKIALVEQHLSRQTLVSTLALAWLEGRITTAQVDTWAAELGPLDADAPSALLNFRLPADQAARLKAALIPAGLSRQTLVATLVRVWLDGRIPGGILD
ncbi:hypothetical protein [Nocardia nova]